IHYFQQGNSSKQPVAPIAEVRRIARLRPDSTKNLRHVGMIHANFIVVG
ncbi:hypothetical protein AVEN_92513-2-2, partial [Araneus ventricosus]